MKQLALLLLLVPVLCVSQTREEYERELEAIKAAKQKVAEAPPAPVPTVYDADSNFWYQKGIEAAKKYPATGPFLGAWASGALLGPLGLIPTGIMHSKRPKIDDHIHDLELLGNPYFVRGWNKNARQRKINNVWMGWALGQILQSGCITLGVVLAK